MIVEVLLGVRAHGRSPVGSTNAVALERGNIIRGVRLLQLGHAVGAIGGRSKAGPLWLRAIRTQTELDRTAVIADCLCRSSLGVSIGTTGVKLIDLRTLAEGVCGKRLVGMAVTIRRPAVALGLWAGGPRQCKI